MGALPRRFATEWEAGAPLVDTHSFLSIPSMPRRKIIPKFVQQCTVGYCRKSTDTEDKQVRSLADQEKLIKDFYATLSETERKFPLKIVHESRSAYHPGRPVFNEIMTDIDRGMVNAIVVLDPTRLSRNPEDTGRLIQRLAEGKLEQVMTVSGKRYSRSDTGQLFMLTLENTMSWKDSADKGARVKVTMWEKAKEGGTTGPAPIGYRNAGAVKGNRWMELDPDTAPKVQRLFILAATGAYTLDALTVEANALGLRTKASKRNADGLPLQKTTLHHVLRNPSYKGVKLYMGEKYPAKHPPLVEVGLWEKVQMELSARATRGARPKDITLRELFTMAGCVRCGKCLQRSLSPYKVKKGCYIVYECKNPKTKCRNCINQEDLMAQLYEDIALLKFDDGDFELMRRTLREVHERETSGQTECRTALEREYRLVEQQITDVFMNIEEAKRMGIFDTVSMKLAQLRMRKEELQEAIQKLHDTSQGWIDHVVGCFELVKVAQRALQIGTPEQRLAVLKALSSSYVVCDKKLICDWLSPFKEKINGGDTNWLLGLDSNQGPWR